MKNLTALILIFFLFSCSETKEKESHIAWFEGSVDDAFAESRKQNKPLFLYWGAVWCPPCQEIKHTVFKSRRFLAQSKSFIPVYLDGDTETAQLNGEKFGVKGYPTMIIFNSKHEEITRIPGGIDISKYNDILALSLNSISPTKSLVQKVLTEPASISADEVKQLAYYSWGQDTEARPKDSKQGSGQASEPELFLTMSQIAADLEPADEISSARFYMQYLHESIRAKKSKDGNEDGVKDIVLIEDAHKRISSILASEELTLACWDTIAYYAADFLPYIADGANAQSLSKGWQESILKLSKHPSLSIAEQLAGLLPTLEFYFSEEEERVLDSDLKLTVMTVIENADKAAKNSFARQSVVNQMNYILQTAKLMTEAKSLLTKELDRSPSPYYFMSSLGGIAEKEANFDLAIEWRRKAFEASVGRATRFQWGANYVAALIRLKPEDPELILSTAIALFDELESGQDAFVGRNFRVLRSLNKKLIAYKGAKEDVTLTAFTASIENRCQEQQSSSIAATNCASLKEKSEA
jgi:thioredoxin-related protein